jgi:transcription termination factor NusB
MKKLVLGLVLSLAIGAAHAAYEPKQFDVKHNSIVSNSARGEDGRNYFVNFIRGIQNKANDIKNNVRDNLKTAGIGRVLGSGSTRGGGTGSTSHSGGGVGGGGGGGGVCR